MEERVLAAARRRCEAAEVFAVWHEETPANFEANRLKSLQTVESSGVALRVVENGRTGFAATTRRDNAAELVEAALETARFGAKATFQFPGPQSYPPVEAYDPATRDLHIESMIELGQSLIDRVRGHASELICEAGVSKSVTRVRIINSRGGEAAYEKTAFGVGIEGTLIRGTDMLFVGDHDSSCSPLADVSHLADETIRQLELAREIVASVSGRLPVVFTPRGVAAAFLPPLRLGFNGRIVLQRASPIGEKLGARAFDSKISLWDDPTLPMRPASRPCDDEGTPARRNTLIDGGVVKTFLYDLQTAGLCGTESTGSASRGLGSLPSPAASALVFAAGTVSFEEMLADLKAGLVVEQLLGAGQGNVLGGEYGGNVLLGYRVQNGRITGRVKDTMVAGNVYQALKDVAAVGSERRWVGGGVYAPAIYLGAVSVSCTA